MASEDRLGREVVQEKEGAAGRRWSSEGGAAVRTRPHGDSRCACKVAAEQVHLARTSSFTGAVLFLEWGTAMSLVPWGQRWPLFWFVMKGKHIKMLIFVSFENVQCLVFL